MGKANRLKDKNPCEEAQITFWAQKPVKLCCVCGNTLKIKILFIVKTEQKTFQNELNKNMSRPVMGFEAL